MFLDITLENICHAKLKIELERLNTLILLVKWRKDLPRPAKRTIPLFLYFSERMSLFAKLRPTWHNYLVFNTCPALK